MDRKYWIGRMDASVTMARGASTAEARLAHYELAGRYSVRAAHAQPFMLPRKGPATPGERVALQLPKVQDGPDGRHDGRR
jgi:hypothetical protein